ncbi:DUF2726 domain-containing protein [Falsiroseomonas oryziterrae]|uniref:DUF2726 domain-containing protein n=1 Tax=Falsiroseomonas oryziterrae TaxID=2911368 RepID=UPI001F46E977|nr:DUF2726 domain-containing protein [Roseomonas sp. NPKOSM-4]
MSPELAVLAETLSLPVAVFLVGLVAGMMIEQLRSKLRRNAWQKRNRSDWSGKSRTTGLLKSAWGPRLDQPLRQPDAADQLRIVMGADFTIQPLLNKSEARVLKELERFVETCNPRWQVMAQVSMGEIVRSKDQAAYGCINSKRVDLLLIDDECLPRHAIEYQGSGHHQGTAAARDAVKKEALRRAGIGYHEVVAGQTTPSDLQRLVEKLVTKPAEAR